MMFAKTARKSVIVTNPAGLHARPCAAIVKTAKRFKSKVEIHKNKETIDAANILDLMTLCAVQGTELLLTAKGPDAEEALTALAEEFEKQYE
jgi:phosphotransferase system HPr (HPr) family protein